MRLSDKLWFRLWTKVWGEHNHTQKIKGKRSFREAYRAVRLEEV